MDFINQPTNARLRRRFEERDILDVLMTSEGQRRFHDGDAYQPAHRQSSHGTNYRTLLLLELEMLTAKAVSQYVPDAART
ncbi:hypothetical protein BRADI_4g28872v3 [Brachypodium distachyon]|uniref:Uncharacterized protein n=1 Tax=Brachypodium distachyon TaxID=15368 RepID=A0A2K2CQZ2_BRADI|nr:hypothetical protein BRADI_4g28872v3 [Brachypodium distachyon]